MFPPFTVFFLVFLGFGEAKICTNVTIPVNISARNGIFNLSEPTEPTEVTQFAQLLTRSDINYTSQVLLGYSTIASQYNISATYCSPSNSSLNGNRTVVQFLTHGFGFDKRHACYWDLSYNNYNYSYTDVAVDQYGYSTLAIDRLGTGNSSQADPIRIAQAPAGLSTIYEVTKMLRDGSIPGLEDVTKPSKVIHVGHSFGSILSHELAAFYPNITDGLVLTGFSLDASYLAPIIASWDLKIAAFNQPFRFGGGKLVFDKGVRQTLQDYNLLDLSAGLEMASVANMLGIMLYNGTNRNTVKIPTTGPVQDLPYGYVTWSDLGSNQYAFLTPPHYDPALGVHTELTKQPFTLGEILTQGGQPKEASDFRGPVLVLTGNEDAIFCGGNCTAMGNVTRSIPAMAQMAFPKSRDFKAYVQPRTGHAINVHYNSSAAYVIMQEFLKGNGL